MKICVIGAGVVGEATGKGFLHLGHEVVFVDVKPEIIANLRAEGFQAFTPEEMAAKPIDYQVSIFTVSTPTQQGEINLKPLKAAAKDLGTRLKRAKDYHVVVVRSTVVPGTTEEIMKIVEEGSGKKAGRDFGVCMNPEYLREHSAVEDFKNPWIVVIGQLDQASGDVLETVYGGFSCPVHRVGLKEAEAQKYVHNLFNAVKITFFNEMRDICRKEGIDAEKIFPLVADSCEGMWNPQYGIRDRGPFDGMCLPKDTQAFLAWAQQRGWGMPLLSTTIEVNNSLLAQSTMTEQSTEKVSMVNLQPTVA